MFSYPLLLSRLPFLFLLCSLLLLHFSPHFGLFALSPLLQPSNDRVLDLQPVFVWERLVQMGHLIDVRVDVDQVKVLY